MLDEIFDKISSLNNDLNKKLFDEIFSFSSNEEKIRFVIYFFIQLSKDLDIDNFEIIHIENKSFLIRFENKESMVHFGTYDGWNDCNNAQDVIFLLLKHKFESFFTRFYTIDYFK